MKVVFLTAIAIAIVVIFLIWFINEIKNIGIKAHENDLKEHQEIEKAEKKYFNRKYLSRFSGKRKYTPAPRNNNQF